MTEEQAASGLYTWMRRLATPSEARGRWAGLIVLSLFALGTELGALVTTMVLFSAIFEPELQVMGRSSWMSPATLMAVLVAVYILRAVLNYHVQIGRRTLARHACLQSAGQVVRHVLRMPLSAHRKWDFGTLMSVIAWAATGMAEVVEATVVALPMDLLSVAAIVGFLAFYQPLLTLILVAVFLTYAVPYFAWKDRAEMLASERQGLADTLMETLSQALLGIREIKIFRVVTRWVKRLGGGFAGLDRTGDEESDLNEKDQQAQLFIFNAFGTVVILAAVLFVIAPRMSDVQERMALTGQVFIFVMAQGLLATPLTSLMHAARSFRQAVPQLIHLRQLSAEIEEAVDEDKAPEPIDGFGEIVFENVTVEHAAEKALDAVSSRIREGSLVGLVGMSGAGKSTFLDLLPRFVAPQPDGEVCLGTRDLDEIDLGTLRSAVCTVSQRPMLFEGTLRDNLAMGVPGAASDEDMLEALRLAQVDSQKDRRFVPQGLDTPVARFGENFSGGEGQRIALARAMLAKPRILLLDEATSNLDALAEARFFRELAARKGQRTVLAITHRLYALTPLCDSILVFQDGRIVQSGSHHELLAQGGLYATLWEAQISLVREELQTLQELASAGATP